MHDILIIDRHKKPPKVNDKSRKPWVGVIQEKRPKEISSMVGR